VHQVQRSFLGEIRTLRPCAACRGYGSIIPEPCRECSGDGRVRSRRSLTVKIPAGVDTGTRVQLSEQGEVGPGGGPAGDLYVEIHVAEHQMFTRHGATRLQVTVPMTAAALGTTLELPTARGRPRREPAPRATWRPASRSTSVGHPVGRRDRAQRPRRPGAPGVGRGDLVVRSSWTPTRLDDRQEELLRGWPPCATRRRPTVGPEHRSVFDS
jgi:molecular chaperone DnaJ